MAAAGSSTDAENRSVPYHANKVAAARGSVSLARLTPFRQWLRLHFCVVSPIAIAQQGRSDGSSSPGEKRGLPGPLPPTQARWPTTLPASSSPPGIAFLRRRRRHRCSWCRIRIKVQVQYIYCSTRWAEAGSLNIAAKFVRSTLRYGIAYMQTIK